MKKQWKDYYEILGIDSDANQEEIKKAYRKLAFELHPDKLTGDEEKFKEIGEAYDILKDPEKRAEFHYAWQKKKLPKPKPVVKPSVITCKDLEPRKSIIKKFIIDNVGGPFDSIGFKTSHDDYVKIINWYPNETPIEVTVKIELNDWDSIMKAYVAINLDEEITYVTINAETKSESVYEPEKTYSYTPPPNQPNTSSSASSNTPTPIKTNWSSLFWLCFIAFIIFLVIPKSSTKSTSESTQTPSISDNPIQNIKIKEPKNLTIPVIPITDKLFSPEVTRAKEIMGKNFIGPETVMKHFNIPLDKNGVEALKTIPFSEKTLLTHKDDCILVADFGIPFDWFMEKVMYPKSKIKKDGYYNGPSFYKDHNLPREPQWHLIYKSPLSNPNYKSYNEQMNSLSAKLYVPKMAVLTYTILLYHLETKEYLFLDFLEKATQRAGVELTRMGISSSDIDNTQKINTATNEEEVGVYGHGEILYCTPGPEPFSVRFSIGYNDYKDYYNSMYYSPETGEPSKTRTAYLAVAIKPEK